MRTTLRHATSLLLLAAATTLSSCSGPDHPGQDHSGQDQSGQSHAVSVTDAWIAEAPATSKVMVGYVTLANNTAQDATILRAHSPNYSSIEFHETVHEDGMARMVRHDSLVIPANGQLELKRGGKHLMLFNPTAKLKAADEVTITLERQDGTVRDIIFDVRKPDF